MIKVKLIEKDEYANYVLEDKDGKRYEININFMGIEKPEVGTIIYIPESVIKENVSLNYGIAGQEKISDDNEIIMLSYEDNKIYLQRYYG